MWVWSCLEAKMLSRVVRLTLIGLVLMSANVFAADIVIDGENNKDEHHRSRFKIFTAEHEAVTRDGKLVKMQSIFKIDLDTGTVWRYRQGVDQKGKPFEEFFEVPNQ